MITHYYTDTPNGMVTACGINFKNDLALLKGAAITKVWNACDCQACLEYRHQATGQEVADEDLALKAELAEALKELKEDVTMDVWHHVAGEGHVPLTCGLTLEEKPKDDLLTDNWSKVTCPGCLAVLKTEAEAVQELDWADIPDIPLPPAGHGLSIDSLEPPPAEDPAPVQDTVTATGFPLDNNVFVFTVDTVPDFEALTAGQAVDGWASLVCDECHKQTHCLDQKVQDLLFSKCGACGEGTLWPLQVNYEEVLTRLRSGAPVPEELADLTALVTDMTGEGDTPQWDGTVHLMSEDSKSPHRIGLCGLTLSQEHPYLVFTDDPERATCPVCMLNLAVWEIEETEVPEPDPIWPWVSRRYQGNDEMSATMLRLLHGCETLAELVPQLDLDERCPFTQNQAIPRSIWIVEHAIAYLAWLHDMHKILTGV